MAMRGRCPRREDISLLKKCLYMIEAVIVCNSLRDNRACSKPLALVEFDIVVHQIVCAAFIIFAPCITRL